MADKYGLPSADEASRCTCVARETVITRQKKNIAKEINAAIERGVGAVCVEDMPPQEITAWLVGAGYRTEECNDEFWIKW